MRISLLRVRFHAKIKVNLNSARKLIAMNQKLAIIFGLLAVGLAYLAIAGNEMQEIKTEIEISAPPEKVWEVLTNIDGWQNWSPIIKKSSGKVVLGSKLDITMEGKEEGKDGPQYNPKITQVEDNKLIRWRAHMMAGFIFTNDKVLELEATPNGTRLVHKELFSGLLAPIFCGQMEKGVPPMLNRMNQSLKDLLEGS